MKKLKEFYKHNRVFMILMSVAAVCLVVILFLVISYIFQQKGGNLYGGRLNGMETVEIKNARIEEIENAIKENNKEVESVSARVSGKIFYINIYLNTGKVADAKSIAVKALDILKEAEKGFYDLAFNFDKLGDTDDKTFPIMGSKKVGNTIISWTNVSE